MDNELRNLIEQRLDAIMGRTAGDPSLSWSGSTTMPGEAVQDFLKVTEDTSLLMKDASAAGSLVVFGGDNFKIPTIGLATRQLQAATANTAPTTIPSFTVGEGVLTPVEVILPVNLPYGMIEDAVGKSAAEVGKAGVNAVLDQAIGDLIMAATLNDLEDLAINGDDDTSGFLDIMDGALKLVAATGNVYAPGTSQTILEHLSGLYMDAPARVRRGGGNAFWVSSDILSGLWDAYAARGTTLGDASLTQDLQGNLRYRGVPVKELVSLPSTRAFFGKIKAWWFGFKREITIERMRQPRIRQIEYTLTARFAHCQILDDMTLGTWTA
jgi:hypothetical protein